MARRRAPKAGTHKPTNIGKKARGIARELKIASNPPKKLPALNVMGEKYAYQAEITVRTSDGRKHKYFSHTYGWDTFHPPSREAIIERIAQDVIDRAEENDSDIELLSVHLVQAWEAV